MDHPNNNSRYSHLMSQGSVKLINDSFLEFNTAKNLFFEAIYKMKITQNFNPSVDKDSIQVMFKIPYDSKLRIDLTINKFKNYGYFYYSKEKQHINIPKNTEEINFIIYPKSIFPSKLFGVFYGIVQFEHMIEIPIEANKNQVEIHLPVIDNSFFETYYLEGEYAKIIKNGFIWKGDKYLRKE